MKITILRIFGIILISLILIISLLITHVFTKYNKDYIGIIRFKLIKDIIIGKLNGTKEDEYIMFDTGAKPTMFSNKYCKLHNLKSKDSIYISTIAEMNYSTTLLIPEINIGPISMDSLEIYSGSTESLCRILNKEIVGIIGRDFFRQYNYYFDFGREEIQIYKSTFKDTYGCMEPFYNGMPAVEIWFQLGGKLRKGTFIIDTGHNGNIVLSKFYKDSLYDQEYSQEYSIETDSGVIDTLIIIKSEIIKICNEKFKNVEVNVNISEGFIRNRSCSGIVGTKLLKKFKLFINNHEQRTYFQKQ